MVISKQVFLHFGVGGFPFQILVTSGSIFFLVPQRKNPVLELQFLPLLCTVKISCVKASLYKTLLCAKLALRKSISV